MVIYLKGGTLRYLQKWIGHYSTLILILLPQCGQVKDVKMPRTVRNGADFLE